MRQDPATAAGNRQVTRDTKVEILGESDGWYEVQTRTRGWVKKDYIAT